MPCSTRPSASPASVPRTCCTRCRCWSGPARGESGASSAGETDGLPLDQAWLDLAALGTGVRSPRIVRPRRPADAQLRALPTPTLVLLGERSKAHDIDKVGTRASRLLPDAIVDVLPGASHHSIPMDPADEINRRLSAFLKRA